MQPQNPNPQSDSDSNQPSTPVSGTSFQPQIQPQASATSEQVAIQANGLEPSSPATVAPQQTASPRASDLPRSEMNSGVMLEGSRIVKPPSSTYPQAQAFNTGLVEDEDLDKSSKKSKKTSFFSGGVNIPVIFLHICATLALLAIGYMDFKLILAAIDYSTSSLASSLGSSYLGGGYSLFSMTSKISIGMIVIFSLAFIAIFSYMYYPRTNSALPAVIYCFSSLAIWVYIFFQIFKVAGEYIFELDSSAIMSILIMLLPQILLTCFICSLYVIRSGSE